MRITAGLVAPRSKCKSVPSNRLMEVQPDFHWCGSAETELASAAENAALHHQGAGQIRLQSQEISLIVIGPNPWPV